MAEQRLVSSAAHLTIEEQFWLSMTINAMQQCETMSHNVLKSLNMYIFLKK